MDLRESASPTCCGVDIDHWYYRAKYRQLVLFVRQHLAHRENVHILDIGCGSGLFIRQLARDFPNPDWRFTGYDPEFGTPPHADDSRVEFVSQINSENYAVDLIVMMDVLEHVVDDSIFVRQILEQFATTPSTPLQLSPFLLLFATVPAMTSLMGAHDRFLGHQRRYDLSDFCGLFEQRARPLLQHYFYATVLLPVWLVRHHSRTMPAQSDLKPTHPTVNALLSALLSLESLWSRCNTIAGVTAVYAGYARRRIKKANLHVTTVPRLKVIVPAFNEAGRLPMLLEQIQWCWKNLDCSRVQIIVADDGSCAQEFAKMQELVQEVAKKLPNEVITYRRFSRNRGKGALLRDLLWEKTDSDIIGFIDADGSVPFEEVLTLRSEMHAHQEWDVIVGSRWRSLGRNVIREGRRHFIGRLFATLLSTAFSMPVYDTQCGLKLFRAHTLTAPIKKLCTNRRWFLDTQLVIVLWFTGHHVVELPISWREIPGSKVRIISDGLRMLLAIYRFKPRLQKFMATQLDGQTPSQAEELQQSA